MIAYSAFGLLSGLVALSIFAFPGLVVFVLFGTAAVIYKDFEELWFRRKHHLPPRGGAVSKKLAREQRNGILIGLSVITLIPFFLPVLESEEATKKWSRPSRTGQVPGVFNGEILFDDLKFQPTTPQNPIEKSEENGESNSPIEVDADHPLREIVIEPMKSKAP
ncbi:MAG: hypothetical protein H6751_00815 [Candidatus Omnitrophica bacterium]|nr:hypothetical protein [Candidatus Omnitrophota bacterium]